MRIVQLIDSLNLGGAECLQLTFAEAALSRGIHPTVMAIVPARSGMLAQQLKGLGATVIEFNNGSLVDPRRFRSLLFALRRGQFDVIHAHLDYSIILGVCAGFLSTIPVVATMHNVHPDRFPRLQALALKFGVKRRIAVGQMVADSYSRVLDNKSIEVVINPVKAGVLLADEERSALRTEILGDGQRPLLISVGRLTPQKGFSDLLDAMKLICQHRPDAFLAIIGEGNLRNELQSQIETLGLQNNVLLMGIRNDVPRLLAASDLYLSASHWEGLPVSVLEAMAAGLAVVATRVGDIPLILHPTRGIVVPPHQPDVLAREAQSLLSDSERRKTLGVAARAYVASNHSVDIWFDKLIEIYKSVLRVK